MKEHHIEVVAGREMKVEFGRIGMLSNAAY